MICPVSANTANIVIEGKAKEEHEGNKKLILIEYSIQQQSFFFCCFCGVEGESVTEVPSPGFGVSAALASI